MKSLDLHINVEIIIWLQRSETVSDILWSGKNSSIFIVDPSYRNACTQGFASC